MPNTHPRFERLRRLPRQLRGQSPFGGTITPARVPLLGWRTGRPTAPFPHPWNYSEPIRILDSLFWNAESDSGPGRHTRYLECPGFAPVLVTRDPALIRAISADTGDKPGEFDRDTMPSAGIARATGSDTLLYANGPCWKQQKKLATPPFARTTLFQPEQFRGFAQTFWMTVSQRLELVRQSIESSGQPLTIELEPEIKALMLEMLVNNFFGAAVSYEEIRDRYVPAIDAVIHHIVRDTVINKLGIPLEYLPNITRGIAHAKRAKADFERLTDLAIGGRHEGAGLWKQFKSDASDDALRSNIRVFLAGALEATTSYATWAIAHLARNSDAQERALAEVRDVSDYTPEALERATYLTHVLNETLRLTPSLYFHPRRATSDTLVTTAAGETLHIPRGTHILLDIWHANRHEDHWGVQKTGYPADQFVPERWENIAAQAQGPNEYLHFGFGHGPRFCPGKSLGQLEVALVVGACVKFLKFRAVNTENPARAGVSTKPLDGLLVTLTLHDDSPRPERAVGVPRSVPVSPFTPESAPATDSPPNPPSGSSRCPFGFGRTTES